MISLIWAMDRNRLIGVDNALPWKLPADMAWFRQQTMGKPILMGRKTYTSIGRPLPGRSNLVLTRQQGLQLEGCRVVHSLDEAKAAVPEADEIMVIGGAEIYALLLEQADRLYITEIGAEFTGDAWFPDFDRKHWRVVEQQTHPVDEKNAWPCHFSVLERHKQAL